MGTKKIPALPAATTFDGTEQFEVVQDNVSSSITSADLITELIGLPEFDAVVDGLYVRSADLAAATNGDGASMVGIEDTGTHYAGATVEAALGEIGTSINTIESDITTIEGRLDDLEATVFPTINAQTGTSYTAVATDVVITMDNGSANYVLVNDGVFAAGATLEIWQKGAGQTEIRADTGMTINVGATQTLFLKEQYSGCSLRFISGSVAYLIGDTEAA